MLQINCPVHDIGPHNKRKIQQGFRLENRGIFQHIFDRQGFRGGQRIFTNHRAPHLNGRDIPRLHETNPKRLTSKELFRQSHRPRIRCPVFIEIERFDHRTGRHKGGAREFQQICHRNLRLPFRQFVNPGPRHEPRCGHGRALIAHENPCIVYDHRISRTQRAL